MLDSIVQDIVYSFRNLRKQRGYTFVVLFTLAIAIGGSTAVFSVVHSVLIRSLPLQSPENLVMVWNRYGKETATKAHVSPPDFLDRKRDSKSLQSMSAIEETSVNLLGKGEVERIRAARVSASLFSTLGVGPFIGRDFLEEEDQPGKNAVVILSHKLWKSRFGSERDLIGQTLNLSGNSFVVIGIMPESFWFPTPETDLWIPIAFTSEQIHDNFRGNEYISMIARIQTGYSLEQVRSEMDQIAASVLVRVPDRRQFLTNAGWGALVIPFRESIVGEVEPALLVLMGAVTFLLLIGCANVANLILARSGGREKEIAIRAVMGANRLNLVRMLFVESLMIALIGGAIGVLLAYWTVTTLPSIAPENLPRLAEIAIDRSVLIYSFAVSLLTGLMIGIVPAFRMSMSQPYQSLKLEGTATPAKSIHRFRNLLVVAEIALALMLATGAGLLTKSFQRLVSVDPGFETENRLTFTLSLPPAIYKENERIVAFYQSLFQQIRSLPGVDATGANASMPFVGHNWTATFMIEGRQLQPGEPQPGFEYRPVSTQYFRAMGIPFLEGRDFQDRDTNNAARVAIIDEKLAKRFWKNQSPIGKRIAFSNPYGNIRWREVIGVVGHVKNSSLKEEGGEQIYFPHSQFAELEMTMVVHTLEDPAKLTGLIRNRIKSLDPNLPMFQIRTMDKILSGSIAQPKFNMLLFIIFAATALALAGIGIYGILSYSVTQRRKEIGIRMALGAQPQNVLLMVVRQSMILAAAGTLVGVVTSILLSRFLRSLLFSMEPIDSAVYATAITIALVIALAASSIPAQRASKLDPLDTLRTS